MRRAWFGPLAMAAFACGSNSATTVFSVDLRAKDGGGPLLITAIGGTLQLSAIALDAGGHQITGVTLSWTSSAPSVAAVSSSGLVTAIGNGSADITASAGVAAGRVPITVAQAPDTLAVTPASASIERGATATFSAAAVDARGHVVSTAPTWKSSDASIATVDDKGVATGLATGDVTITATLGAKSSAASLSVTVPAAGAVTVSSAQTGALTSIDDTRQLTASAIDARGAAVPEAALTWDSSDATVASVSPSGLVTAKKNGSATVTATSGSAHGSIAVTVAQAVHTVSVAPGTQSIAPDATFTFTAQALDAHAHPVAGAAAATWTVDDTNVATIDSGTGQVNANANAAALASTQVHAKIGLVTGDATLTVDPAMAPVVSIDLPQPAGSLASIGATVQLTATAKNSANNPVPGVNFDWHSDDETVATVSTSGRVTAAGNGSTQVHVSGGGKSAQVTIDVHQILTQVVMATPAFTGFTSIDDTLQLSAAAEDSNHQAVTEAPIAWSSSASTVISVSNTGLATAKANGGPVTITATSGAFHDQVSLTVAQAVHAVNVSPPSDSIGQNTTIDFTAAGVDAHGHLVAGAPAATWQSDNAGVTFADPGSGHAAVGGFAALTVVTITASISDVDGAASLTVDPTLIPVDHVVVTAGGPTTLASIDDFVDLSAQARDSSDQPIGGVNFNWSVQDGSADVVTVNSTGRVTAVGNGQKTIVASTGGKSGFATITVEQTLVSVAISKVIANAPTTLTSFGDTLALQAEARDANGHPLPPGPVFKWRSDSANATVDPDTGVVTAVSDGAANIIARANDATDSDPFAVTVAQAVDHISISASGPTTLHSIGDQVQLTAHAFDARNDPMTVDFTWSPTIGAAATVDPNGLVTAKANGSVNIQASAGGKTGSLPVTVSQVVVSVAVTGTSSFSSLELTAQLSAAALDANSQVVPRLNSDFDWRSSDSATIGVNATGVITSHANGSANVFAKDKVSLVESGAHAVTVSQVVDSVSVTGNASLGAIDAQTTLSATALDANSHAVAGITFGWSIQDASTNVITVNPVSGVVTAVSNGSKTVVASGGGQSGTRVVTVQQVVASLSATGGKTLQSINETTMLGVTAFDANNHAVSGATITWSSDNTPVAIVSTAGVVTAKANGTAHITAHSGSVSSNAVTIQVQQAVATVIVLPNPAGISAPSAIGSLQFTATAKDGGGTVVPGPLATTWKSSNTLTVTIDSNGLATSKQIGTVTITATISGVDGTATLAVSDSSH